MEHPVEAAEKLNALISDLLKIRRVCDEEHLEYLPKPGIQYLIANGQILRFFIHQVYSKTEKPGRIALLNSNSELDRSVVEEGFKEIALATVREDNAELNSLGFLRIREDSLSMLLRVLRYAKYIPLDSCPLELARSPVENFGLKKRFGSFTTISKEEFESVPWKISDVLYNDRKNEVFRKFKEDGLDMKTHQAAPLHDTYPVALDRWQAELALLLEYKMECDLAVVIETYPFDRPRFIHALDSRLEYEGINHIQDLRESLESLLRGVMGTEFNRNVGRNLQDSLQPLLSSVEELRSQLVSPDWPQPRLAIYESVRRLIDSKGRDGRSAIVQKNYFDNRGANIGAVGPNATASQFTQVLNQYAADLDLKALGHELQQIREAMLAAPEKDRDSVAIGAVAQAEKDAKDGQRSKIMTSLSKVGKWALDVAKELGTSLAVEAIKKAAGF